MASLPGPFHCVIPQSTEGQSCVSFNSTYSCTIQAKLIDRALHRRQQGDKVWIARWNEANACLDRALNEANISLDRGSDSYKCLMCVCPFVRLLGSKIYYAFHFLNTFLVFPPRVLFSFSRWDSRKSSLKVSMSSVSSFFGEIKRLVGRMVSTFADFGFIHLHLQLIAISSATVHFRMYPDFKAAE
ncbi:hypothetical protein O6H91_22G053200 [Diphasiastrum complanatum]|uniref:Uncharacterized protein n=1 Tax=Diphasiastrum complanatum TaxID=34168 RepID=A0ACC2AFH7_DIPCM|nr:hypothetical protein O6H91_22G053200 [Diphasiastrum complanatum]